MSTSIDKVKRIGQFYVNLLFAVEAYALKHGYNRTQAKALAVGAIERRRQAGYMDFAMKIHAIQRDKAKVGKHSDTTFKRLTVGRVATVPVDLRLVNHDNILGRFGFCCACDQEMAE